MNARLEPCALYRRAEAVNDLMEAEETWQEAGSVRAAISAGGGSLNTVNDLKRLDSTHTAVTWDEVKPGEAIRPEGGPLYEVTFTIPGTRRRMRQLFLKAEEKT